MFYFDAKLSVNSGEIPCSALPGNFHPAQCPSEVAHLTAAKEEIHWSLILMRIYLM